MITRDLSPAERAVVARFEAAPDAPESLRERVARAIWECSDGFISGVAWNDAPTWRRNKALRQADAAIAVMRGDR